MKYIYLLLVVVFIGLIVLAENCDAESLYFSYYSEEIPYVFHRGKPLPEHSKYKCIKGNLNKYKYGVEYMYTGKPKKCEIKFMTRKEYEEYNPI